MSREWTPEECRAMFLDHIAGSVAYALGENRWRTTREKLNGLAFMILTAIDGESIGLPAFELLTAPHPDDERYHKTEGTNYWPTGFDLSDGELHSRWAKRE